MKRVIDGLVFDTQKAIEVASDSADCGMSDFRWYTETLYRTPNGRWFIAGEGGPMSHYAQSYGNSQTGGSGLRVLDAAEAQQWCEAHEVDPEVMREYFELQEA